MFFFTKIALPLLLMILCSGCYGAKETDEISYVIAFGIDKAADGKLKVTSQIALPSALASNNANATKTKDQPKTWITNTIIIPTPAENQTLNNSTLSRSRNASHLVAIICSEEVARTGLSPIIAYFMRSHEFRETTYLIIVPGSAEEYIRQNNPKISVTLFRYYESLFTKNNNGYYLPGTLHRFYSSLKNGGSSPYAAYSAFNAMKGRDNPTGVNSPQQKGNPYLAGGIPRTGTVNPIESAGLAIFHNDKMVGVLNSDETRAVSLLQGNFLSGYLGIVDPLSPEKDSVSINVYADKRPKVTAVLTGETPHFTIRLNLEAEILGVTSGINYEAVEYRSLLEEELASLFKQQVLTMLQRTKQLGSDPVGFGLYLRKEYFNTNDLQQRDMTALYQAAEFTVDVSVKIRRTGLIWRTTKSRNG